jgi:hypothetical protein
MNEEERGRYALKITEGQGMVVTEIQVRGLTNEPIEGEELDALISEFNSRFPNETYHLNYRTKPDEDNEILYVYVNLQGRESIQRSGTVNKRVIVPAQEVAERLEGW